MDDRVLSRELPWDPSRGDRERLLTREWIVANGRGGYASGSISGVATRRYHGLLIAAMPAPLGRVVMLTHLGEEVRIPGGEVFALGGEETEGMLEIPGAAHLAGFRLELGLPVWRYRFGGVVLEKRVLLPHMQNTVHVTYELLQAPGDVRLRMRPSLHFRPHEERVHLDGGEYEVRATGRLIEVRGDRALPALRLLMHGERSAVVLDGGRWREYLYRVEAARGYDSRGALWSPGYLRADLSVGERLTLVASTEDVEVLCGLSPDEARTAELERRRKLLELAHGATDDVAKELVLAADQYVIRPAARVADQALAEAAGEEQRSVIAGYHWFTDWGRDTMISLEGLCLATGRSVEAAWILRTFARAIRDGLIPNMFPEHDRSGLYHTADATLWFFHAVQRYVAATGDRSILATLVPRLDDVVEHHLRGTRFGIRVDPTDGLLVQGADGYQLTWMDAKVGDWVVTPRRGKAVEINALWYNALKLLAGWMREQGNAERAEVLEGHAERARIAFDRFWYEPGQHLLDVIDGEHGDESCLRPNQIFAISLDHPVLAPERWEPVLRAVTDHLLTPYGLRSLAPGHPDYKRRYDGDLRARDAAYHQGTVWGWLIGPYVDAWLKVHPGDLAGARAALEGFVDHLGEAGVGHISEIFDAEAPYTPRGCIAQAWSVAEVLRCWVRTTPRQ